jgi:hypothetical protein
MPNENGVGGESQPETEVASQEPENQIQELEEIEKMLNEEYPLMEGGLMDSRTNESVLEEAAIETDSDTQASVNTEVINPEFMEEHPVDEQHLLDEGMNQDHPMEPSVDPQAPESAMDMPEERPSEPSIEEQATEAHPTDEHAMDEHANDHAMETEAELDPQHL